MDTWTRICPEAKVTYCCWENYSSVWTHEPEFLRKRKGHTVVGQIVHQYRHMEQILSRSELGVIFFVVIYFLVLFVPLLLMWIIANFLYSNICSRTLQMHVCEHSCAMVPLLYHKIGVLTNCLCSHCQVSSLSAARGWSNCMKYSQPAND
jgi:hypothetical protein